MANPHAHVGSAGSARSLSGSASAVVGLQWGDEGKGKLVDLLAQGHDAVVRYNGGANAGHSVVVGGTRYALHLVPSGILYPGKRAVIGNGVVVDPFKLVDELRGLEQRSVDTSGLVLSDRAHVVLPWHQLEDALREEMLASTDAEPAGQSAGRQPSNIGTTKRGIGPAYADKAQRAGAIRVIDLLDEGVLASKLALALKLKKPSLKRSARGTAHESAVAQLSVASVLEKLTPAIAVLAPRVRDTTLLLHEMLSQGKRLLFESANGTLLDVDHGTYPYVTSSSCVVAGVGTGAGVPPQRLSRVVGVMKAYTTRVGSGPLPTELHSETGQRIRDKGREYGTTTGRPRRVGWLDLVAVRHSVMVNGVTDIALTMLDVLSGLDEIGVCTSYAHPRAPGGKAEHFHPDAGWLAHATPTITMVKGFADDIAGVRDREKLPARALDYVRMIERFVGVPVSIVSVGPGREQTLPTPEARATLLAGASA
jgi:adenylosuccinate synthase